MTTINPSPQPFLDHLVATAEQLSVTRSILRRVVQLDGDSATLSDKELRDRLVALAESCAR